jgi:ribose-phosphate pyrophosphokinase
MQVLAFAESAAPAAAFAAALGARSDVVDVHRFPDGESRVRLPPALGDDVVVYRSLDRPNDKLVELLLAARTARELGARRLTLVAPYLCYMRQDVAFVPGEAVSQRIVGRFLAELFDALVTVDPHLHRVATLQEAVPLATAVALSAAPAMGRFLAERSTRPLLVGPDAESEQWVRAVAAPARLDYVVAHKTRRGDRDVEVQLPARDYAGADAVLVDDVASSGQTLAVAARALREAGARHVDVLVTHALFAADAVRRLDRAGVTDIWSSDSIPHASNAFALASLLADAVASAMRQRST